MESVGSIVFGHFARGLAMVQLKDKYSLINTDGKLIGDGNLWFDDFFEDNKGLLKVELNHKYSFINTNGELIGDGNLWFDYGLNQTENGHL